MNTTHNRESFSHLVETEERLARSAEVKALDRCVGLCVLQVGALHLVPLKVITLKVFKFRMSSAWSLHGPALPS